MNIFSKEIIISNLPRGFNIITNKILNSLSEIEKIENGILFLFIKHTSASLCINENTDSTVRNDLENYFNKTVKEDLNEYEHNYEGEDDMPAHIKSTLIGNNIHIPILNGKLDLGTWQGIYLCEHRNHSTNRKIRLTLLREN